MSAPETKPVIIPPDVAKAIISLYGAILFNWAMAEHALINGTAIVYHQAGGKTLEKQIPKDRCVYTSSFAKL